MKTWEEMSFVERIKSLSKKEVKMLLVCSAVFATFFTAHAALMTKAFNDGVAAQKAEAQRAEENRLLGKIDTMETELRGLRQPYIDKKGEEGAKEIDAMIDQLEALRERVKNTRYNEAK